MNYRILNKKIVKNIAVKIAFLCRWLSDEHYLKIIYFIRTGHKLNIAQPKRFNEKIQWLKLHNRVSEYVSMVDKAQAKDFATKRIGYEFVIPTIGIWDRPEEIVFEELPEKFVLKCTHDSGGVIICSEKNAFDFEGAKKKLNYLLRRNYYYQNREWIYQNIQPRIIAEQYIGDFEKNDSIDYKFMCFDGKVKCLFTCTERFTEEGLKVTFFDRDFNLLSFERQYPKSSKIISKPQNYEKMIEIAEKLADGIKFVRVDLYNINGDIYFGEMTFFPGSGMEKFRPDEWDYIMGEWLDLSEFGV